MNRKKVVWLVGLQHCAETGAGWGLEAILQFLVSPDPVAAEARRKMLVKVVPIVNIDALAEGRGRIHSSGRNLNREWERPDPAPEIAAIRKTIDAWKARGNPIDAFIDIHGFSSRDGRWSALVMPEGAYVGQQAKQYKRLREAIRKHVPTMRYSPHEAKGYAQGAACRRWGALSMSIDGWVYTDPSGKVASLSSRYERHARIVDLDEMRAAGEAFARALAEFPGEPGD